MQEDAVKRHKKHKNPKRCTVVGCAVLLNMSVHTAILLGFFCNFSSVSQWHFNTFSQSTINSPNFNIISQSAIDEWLWEGSNGTVDNSFHFPVNYESITFQCLCCRLVNYKQINNHSVITRQLWINVIPLSLLLHCHVSSVLIWILVYFGHNDDSDEKSTLIQSHLALWERWKPAPKDFKRSPRWLYCRNGGCSLSVHPFVTCWSSGSGGWAWVDKHSAFTLLPFLG